MMLFMKTTVKNISDTRVVVSVVVEKAALEDAEQVALKKLSKNMKLNGFRKGHVPIAVAKKNIDPNVLAEETLQNALSRAVAEAFLSEKLQALQRPEVDVKKYVPGESLEFTAESDVLPKVKLGDYKKLKSEKKIDKATKKDIEDILSRIAKGFSEKEAIEMEAELGHEAVIDFIGKRDGEAFPGGTGNDYPLELGSNTFIPGFEDSIVGMKVGDKKDIELTFPKDYHAKDLAGQKVVFETTLKKLHKIVTPEYNDEFAAKVGPFTSMDDLRKDIESEINAQREREADDKQKDDLVRQLVSKSKAPVPKSLHDDQVKTVEQDLMQNLMYQGLTIEQYWEKKGFKDRDEWVEKEAGEVADERIKASLVLAELSKELKIEATADELAERINFYKKQYSNNADLAKRFDEPEVHREIANQIINEKAVEELVKINSK